MDQAEKAGRLVKSALGLLVLYLLVNAPTLFVAADPNQIQPVVNHINFGLHLGLVVAVIATVINLLRDAVRLIRERLGRGQEAAVGL
jgi:hypothetical protein